MDAQFCIAAARRSLTHARRYLKTGEAVNWGCDNITSAIHWAMEGWLIGNGHHVTHRNGWLDTYQAFQKYAPDEFNAPLLKLYAQALYLEFVLMGDSDMRPAISISEWEIKMRECLDNSEITINALLTEIARKG